MLLEAKEEINEVMKNIENAKNSKELNNTRNKINDKIKGISKNTRGIEKIQSKKK